MSDNKDKKPDSYVVCIDNTDYTASLEKHKIYRVVRDEAAMDDGDIRVVDESGGDFLISRGKVRHHIRAR